MNITEEQFNHGAISLNPVHRWLHRKINRKKLPKVARGTGVDWNVGYDVRDTIGPIKIKNQGQNSSCGGQAGSYFLEIQRRLQKINEGGISAKSIYSPIAYSGGGTTVKDLEQQICAHGANLEATVPSQNPDGSPFTEEQISDKSWITPSLTEDANTRAGYTPYDIPVNVDSIAQAMKQWGATFMEIQGQNGHTPGWQTATPQFPDKNNQNEIWSHFQCLIGFLAITPTDYISIGSGVTTIDAVKQKYKDNPLLDLNSRTVKVVLALQSEGENWGDSGIQAFSESYFQSKYVVDTFTAIYDTKIIPSSINFSWYAWLLRWFRLQFGLSPTSL